ncbi:hypothetical protein [Bacillus sp. AFS040349]|uniref:hypothetical protein n=1 Tax=Bacillus sp. AFS040349 TaxID=2033502 RepID=UPI000BFCCF02|nr:hypothetical protein [Bacillus sp. AFS040349]PGT83243.1 hypothetical protein COD11_12980 [Bacillus sp. AFS040349]
MDIKLLPNMVSVNGDCTKKENVMIEIVDYGDQYFDVHFLKKDEDCLLGTSAFCGIHYIDNALTKAGYLARQANLELNQIRFRFVTESNE